MPCEVRHWQYVSVQRLSLICNPSDIEYLNMRGSSIEPSMPATTCLTSSE